MSLGSRPRQPRSRVQTAGHFSQRAEAAVSRGPDLSALTRVRDEPAGPLRQHDLGRREVVHRRAVELVAGDAALEFAGLVPELGDLLGGRAARVGHGRAFAEEGIGIHMKRERRSVGRQGRVDGRDIDTVAVNWSSRRQPEAPTHPSMIPQASAGK